MTDINSPEKDLLFTIQAGDHEKPESMKTIKIYTTGQVKGFEDCKNVIISNAFDIRCHDKIRLEESRGHIVIVR
jgi:hypothetical protein